MIITLTKWRSALGKLAATYEVGQPVGAAPNAVVESFVLPPGYFLSEDGGAIFDDTGTKCQIIELGDGRPALIGSHPGVAALDLAPKLAPAADCKSVREALGLKQPEFARLIRSTQQHVSKWERGVMTPTATVQVLLELLARRPELAEDLRAIADRS